MVLLLTITDVVVVVAVVVAIVATTEAAVEQNGVSRSWVVSEIKDETRKAIGEFNILGALHGTWSYLPTV